MKSNLQHRIFWSYMHRRSHLVVLFRNDQFVTMMKFFIWECGYFVHTFCLTLRSAYWVHISLGHWEFLILRSFPVYSYWTVLSGFQVHQHAPMQNFTARMLVTLAHFCILREWMMVYVVRNFWKLFSLIYVVLTVPDAEPLALDVKPSSLYSWRRWTLQN